MIFAAGSQGEEEMRDVSLLSWLSVVGGRKRDEAEQLRELTKLDFVVVYKGRDG